MDGAMRADLIGVIEAAYHVDADSGAWMSSLLRAARPALDFGLGVCAYAYDARDPNAFRATPMAALGIRSDLFRDRVEAALPHLDAAYVERSYLTVSCARVGATLDTPRLRELFGYLCAPTGARDMLAVNAIDPSGVGVYLGALLPAGASVTSRRRATWSRIAAHVAAGHRLLRRLGAEGSAESAEARLRPSGRVDETTGAADTDEARRLLSSAAKAIEHARGCGRAEAERAVRGWRGLIAARWTLVDEFAADGRRYLLARRNDAAATRPAALSARERQALGYARLGHSNKLIAYELGIAASTVGVLLHRAALKLGARTRAELIAAYLLTLASSSK
jgi:DNA-binding CsgD family transcriptional regulator